MLRLIIFLNFCLIFFLRFWRQAGALAHSAAHHANKPSPTVQYVWFGWNWGRGISFCILCVILHNKPWSLILALWSLILYPWYLILDPCSLILIFGVWCMVGEISGPLLLHFGSDPVFRIISKKDKRVFEWDMEWNITMFLWQHWLDRTINQVDVTISTDI